jgi:hypothetical protein
VNSTHSRPYTLGRALTSDLGTWVVSAYPVTVDKLCPRKPESFPATQFNRTFFNEEETLLDLFFLGYPLSFQVPLN